MKMLSREERWDELFNAYDLDGNGYLSEEDIILAYQKFLAIKGIPEDSEIGQQVIGGMRTAFAEDVMRSDLNGDGKVTRDEWHTHYGALLHDAGGGALLPSVEIFQAARNGLMVYDVDGDGRISQSDYIVCASVFAPQAQEEALVAHWAAITHNFGANGELDYDQFLVLFLQVWCSTLPLPFWFPTI